MSVIRHILGEWTQKNKDLKGKAFVDAVNSNLTPDKIASYNPANEKNTSHK